MAGPFLRTIEQYERITHQIEALEGRDKQEIDQTKAEEMLIGRFRMALILRVIALILEILGFRSTTCVLNEIHRTQIFVSWIHPLPQLVMQ